MLRRSPLVLLALLVSACGGSADSGGGVTPPAAVASVTVSAAAASVNVGATVQVTASLRDASGNLLTGRTVTWASSNSAVATVSATGLVTALAGGTTTVSATAEGKFASVAITVLDVGPASVSVSSAPSSLAPGDTVRLVATVRDASGNVLTGQVITWTSSDATKASVSASGLVTALAGGTTTVSATAEGKSASVAITVLDVGPASVSMSSAPSSLAPGDTVRLVATVRDASGNVLTGQVITWTSSDATKASVSASGLVTVLGTAAVPHITSIIPAQLTVGATMTITGTGFGTEPGTARVTVAGGAVLVTSATATQIIATVPSTVPCTLTGPTAVTVSTALGSVTITATVATKSASTALSLASHADSAQHPIAIATQRTLAVGQSMMITDPAQVGCNELVSTGAHYLVSVYNDGTTANQSTSFEMRGAGGVSVVALHASRVPLAPIPSAVPPTRLPGAAPAAGAFDGIMLHLHDGHAQRMARTVAAMQPLIHELKAGGPRPRYNVAAGAPARLVIPTTVDSTVTLKYPTAGSCTNFTTVTARVVYVGTHSIVLEASDGPLAGTIDSVYVALAQQFDTLMYPILTNTFGDPMAFDDSLSHIGKVAMLFTKKVNTESANLLGFVSPCDMLPPAFDAQAPASNHTELFYARVPTSTTGSASSFSVLGEWRRIMGSTLIHETKHITAVAERFADPVGTDLEDSWLEEGTAQVASEIYARTLYGVAWKSDATYANTVYCDLRGAFTTGPCAGAEYLMADQFAFLYDFMRQNEATSFLSNGTDDANIYGSAWLFARWMLDQYSTNEADLMKPLVRDATMHGVANVTDKTGRSWDELDGNFTMMLAADDYPGFTPPTGARFQELSWNLRDIYAGLSADTQGEYVPWPLGVRAIAFGSFVAQVPTLAGGSAALFDMSGSQSAPQLLDVHALSGAPLPPGHPLRIVIVRVQ